MLNGRNKVVYQCSGCENPIRNGDKFVKTPYGYFCADCFTEGIAVADDPIRENGKCALCGKPCGDDLYCPDCASGRERYAFDPMENGMAAFSRMVGKYAPYNYAEDD